MAKLTQTELDDWIKTKPTGIFHYTKAMDGTVNSNLFPQLRVMVNRAGEKGLCVRADGRDGYWRPTDTQIEEICWCDGD